MKILQINKFIYRRRGAETYLFNVSGLLQQHGHQVAFWGMEHPQNIVTAWNSYFVSNVDYGKPNLKAAMRMVWSREAQRKLDQLLDQFKPDVAHIHNIYHQISPAVLVTLKKRGIPIVLTLHDYKLVCPNYELYTENEVCNRCQGGKYYNAVLHSCLKNSRALSALAMFEMYLHKAQQVYERNVDCFIAPSQFMKSTILEWGARVKRVEVIPNIVYTAVDAGVAQSAGADSGFLYAGSLSEIKGVQLLLDNFNQNRYSRPLRLAGSGPLAKAVVAAAKHNPNIVFLGQLNAQQLKKELKRAYAVIVPSRYHDNFPYAVLEAYAAGKPVIGANRGGITELIDTHYTGWLFEPNKLATLTAAVSHALANPTVVAEYGQHAYKLAQTIYSPTAHYEQLLEIYNSVRT